MAEAASEAVSYIFVNEGADYVEPATRNYLTGNEALLGARCSTFLAQNGIAGARACEGTTSAWYKSNASSGCHSGRVELVDTSQYRPIDAYTQRFAPPSPPPRPPPKPQPPAQPLPPPPGDPPATPLLASLDAARNFATKIQQDFCDRCAPFNANPRFVNTELTWV